MTKPGFALCNPISFFANLCVYLVNLYVFAFTTALPDDTQPDLSVLMTERWSGFHIRFAQVLDRGGLGIVSTGDNREEMVNTAIRRGECNDNGWSYAINFENKVTGASHKWQSTSLGTKRVGFVQTLGNVSQVRRRRWLRRAVFDSGDSMSNIANSATKLQLSSTCALPLRIVSADLCGELMLQMPAWTSGPRKRYTVLTSGFLIWFDKEPRSSLDFDHPGGRLSLLKVKGCTGSPRDDESGTNREQFSWPFELHCDCDDATTTESLEPIKMLAESEAVRTLWITALMTHVVRDEPAEKESSGPVAHLNSLESESSILSSSFAGGATGLTQKKFRMVRKGTGSTKATGPVHVQYLPLLGDVQLAVWKSVRRLISRFAFAEIPKPNRWRNVTMVGGAFATAGLVVIPGAGLLVLATASITAATVGK